MTASTTRRTTAARSRIAAVGAIAVAGALILTGCGDQTDKASSTPSGSAANSSAPLFAKLPKKIQDAGVIKVGTDATYAPMEFTEGGKIVGVDPDVAAALAKQLGVQFKFESGTFDTLIGSMQTGRSDLVMSSLTDTKARQEGLDDKGAKTGAGVDFVDYFSASTGILVKKGNPRTSRPSTTCAARRSPSSAAPRTRSPPRPRPRSARRTARASSRSSPSRPTPRPRPA